MERLIVSFKGRVQGVGFRATTLDIAGKFDVVGRVCNVSDGSVSLRAEGSSPELQRFLQAIEARFARHIVETKANWESIGEPTWSDFRVAHSELK